MKTSRYVIFILVLVLIFWSTFFTFQNMLYAANSSWINATAKISVCGNHIKEGGEHCDGNDFGGKTCTDFGFEAGDLSCSTSCEYNTTNCTTSAEKTAIPLFTSSIGGSYNLDNAGDSLEIDLPVNFYNQDLRLQMFSYEPSFFESSKPAPSGKLFSANPYNLVFINPDGNTISTIFQPATITLAYTNSDISGINENTLVPYHWGSHDSSWSPITGYTLDKVNNKIIFTTSTFSSFAIFGSPLPSCGDHTCNGSENCSTCSIDCGNCPVGGGGGGGGGGGSSGYIIPATSVTFSGRAYPKSTITLLKDAQIAATTIADANANFNFTLSGISSGNYIFSVYSEDNKGNRSSLLTFPVSVTSGTATSIGGIFIAPTIAVDKKEVKKGDDIQIFGQSSPNSEITISVNSDEEFFSKIKTDKSGVYLYNFDTTPLEIGQHSTKSKSAVSGDISSFSKVISFTVGTKNVYNQTVETSLKGDVNSDKRVNLVDFSIAAFWYKKPFPPASVDLNKDGKVDLIDFSIMAYYWTG